MPESGDYTLAENSPCIGSGQEGLNMGALEIGVTLLIYPTEFSLINPENNFQLLIEQNNDKVNHYHLDGKILKMIMEIV